MSTRTRVPNPFIRRLGASPDKPPECGEVSLVGPIPAVPADVLPHLGLLWHSKWHPHEVVQVAEVQQWVRGQVLKADQVVAAGANGINFPEVWFSFICYSLLLGYEIPDPQIIKLPLAGVGEDVDDVLEGWLWAVEEGAIAGTRVTHQVDNLQKKKTLVQLMFNLITIYSTSSLIYLFFKTIFYFSIFFYYYTRVTSPAQVSKVQRKTESV